MLDVRRISKDFGGVRAVNALDLQVAQGEVHGLIGPNGAGKTTVINLISGLLSVSTGEIHVDGQQVHRLSADKRAHAGIARTFQNLRLFRNLSVGRNIEIAAMQVNQGASDPTLVDEAIDRFGLRPFVDQSPTSLSYGHMRRVEIVRALALRPKVLMLDEPAAGMNPEETEELFQNLVWLRNRHPCAILLIEHDLKFIMSACDRVTVMNMGSLLASGTPKDVTKNKEVIQAYLG